MAEWGSAGKSNEFSPTQMQYLWAETHNFIFTGIAVCQTAQNDLFSYVYGAFIENAAVNSSTVLL